jgi:hypothetical protein
MRVASLPSYLEKSSKIVGINGIIFILLLQVLKINKLSNLIHVAAKEIEKRADSSKKKNS